MSCVKIEAEDVEEADKQKEKAQVKEGQTHKQADNSRHTHKHKQTQPAIKTETKSFPAAVCGSA